MFFNEKKGRFGAHNLGEAVREATLSTCTAEPLADSCLR